MSAPLRKIRYATAACLALAVLLLSACDGGGGGSSGGDITDEFIADAVSRVEMPVPGDNVVVDNELVSIEVSKLHEGYFFVTVKAALEKKLKLSVALEGAETTYYYDLFYGTEAHIIPLSSGSGRYKITVLQNTTENRYAFVAGFSVTVELTDENAPFLLPNDIVSYSRTTDAVGESFRLTFEAKTELDKVTAIFKYIINNIDYDYEKAERVKNETGYLPDVDETLRTKKGICYDYSALLASMLRANGIPAKLIIGYADPGNVYHAWNMIYITDVGWLNTEIFFDGVEWQLADSTYAASNNTATTYYPIYTY